MISHVHKYCRIPLSAKIRMLDNIPSTIEYAKRIERAGASMLTIHGRTREQKGFSFLINNSINYRKRNLIQNLQK
jgi:tRNA-dihydrouridine synthase 1